MATLVWRAAPLFAFAVYTIACGHPSATSQAPQPDSTRVAADTSHPAQRSPTTVTSVSHQVAPAEPPEMALQGKVPGLEITRTNDGSVAIRIRGPSSFFGSGEPLYVLDGIPITPGPNGRIGGLYAADIESIEVLKDPAQTALYGVRGGNGVIVIKTKQAPSRHK